MRSIKLKNDAFLHTRALPFVALWAGSYGLTWLLEYSLVYQIYNYVSSQVGLIVLIGLTALLPALIQVQVAERMVHQSMRRWMLYTIPGAIISIALITNMRSISENNRIILLILCVMLPNAFLQTIWLHKRVNSAWLWILASIAGSLLFALPFREDSSPSILVAFAGLLYGLIQGSVMRYLLSQPRVTEKARFDFATDAIEEEVTRIDRLHTAEQPSIVVPRTSADEQASQTKTR